MERETIEHGHLFKNNFMIVFQTQMSSEQSMYTVKIRRLELNSNYLDENDAFCGFYKFTMKNWLCSSTEFLVFIKNIEISK
jgi:hypothetical protein